MTVISFSIQHTPCIVRAIRGCLPPIGRLEVCYLVNKHGIRGPTGRGWQRNQRIPFLLRTPRWHSFPLRLASHFHKVQLSAAGLQENFEHVYSVRSRISILELPLQARTRHQFDDRPSWWEQIQTWKVMWPSSYQSGLASELTRLGRHEITPVVMNPLINNKVTCIHQLLLP
jgi:hypothetical protein